MQADTLIQFGLTLLQGLVMLVFVPIGRSIVGQLSEMNEKLSELNRDFTVLSKGLDSHMEMDDVRFAGTSRDIERIDGELERMRYRTQNGAH